MERAAGHPLEDLYVFAVAIIVAVGFVLRAWRLGAVPGPFADEVVSAESLHSLFNTRVGGGILSIVTPILDGRLLVKTVMGAKLIDLRIVSLVFGLGTILIVIDLVRRLYGRTASIIAGGAASVMPWAIYYSRIFIPASEYVFFSILMVYAGLALLDRRSNMWLVVGCVSAAVTVYIYPTSIVSTPLLIAVVVVYRRRAVVRMRLSIWLSSILLFLALMIPYAVGHLVDVGPSTATINRVIGSRLLLNSGLSLGAECAQFLRSYISYFTPAFLAVRGDPNPMQSIQTLGEIGPVLYVIGLIGIIIAIIRIRQPKYQFVILILLVFPVGDALTLQNSIGNSDVAALGIVPWCMLVGIGGAAIIHVVAGATYRKTVDDASAGISSENHSVQTKGKRRNIRAELAVLCSIMLLFGAQLELFAPTYFGRYDNMYGYRFEYGFSSIAYIIKQQKLNSLPVTIDAGYQRSQMYQYFNNNKINIVSSYQSCRLLPYDYLHYAVAEQVLVIREGWDYASTPGCVNQLSLIRKEINALRLTGRTVKVEAQFRNDPQQLSGPRYHTVVLLLQK